MATGNVLQAPVFARRIVKSNPAGQMRQGLSSRPVRVVLMPRDYSAVVCGFAEELVVPKANWSA
jgi:hypothetical protein